MSEYIVIVQESDNEMARREFYCDAESASQAETQALEYSKDINCIAVYERVR
jgi:hypothetical protein